LMECPHIGGIDWLPSPASHEHVPATVTQASSQRWLAGVICNG
jgi:hypothetical protein